MKDDQKKGEGLRSKINKARRPDKRISRNGEEFVHISSGSVKDGKSRRRVWRRSMKRPKHHKVSAIRPGLGRGLGTEEWRRNVARNTGACISPKRSLGTSLGSTMHLVASIIGIKDAEIIGNVLGAWTVDDRADQRLFDSLMAPILRIRSSWSVLKGVGVVVVCVVLVEYDDWTCAVCYNSSFDVYVDKHVSVFDHRRDRQSLFVSTS